MSVTCNHGVGVATPTRCTTEATDGVIVAAMDGMHLYVAAFIACAPHRLEMIAEVASLALPGLAAPPSLVDVLMTAMVLVNPPLFARLPGAN